MHVFAPHRDSMCLSFLMFVCVNCSVPRRPRTYEHSATRACTLNTTEEKERERIPLGKDSKVRFVSVGGVVDIQQLQLPPASKKAKAWIMREITQLADKLHVIPYPNTTDNSGTSGVRV